MNLRNCGHEWRDSAEAAPAEEDTKGNGIRRVDGAHDVDCKIDGVSLMLQSEFLKQA